MFPIDPPENNKKPLVFSCFQGDQKGILGRNGLKLRLTFQEVSKTNMSKILKLEPYATSTP